MKSLQPHADFGGDKTLVAHRAVLPAEENASIVEVDYVGSKLSTFGMV